MDSETGTTIKFGFRVSKQTRDVYCADNYWWKASSIVRNKIKIHAKLYDRNFNITLVENFVNFLEQLGPDDVVTVMWSVFSSLCTTKSHRNEYSRSVKISWAKWSRVISFRIYSIKCALCSGFMSVIKVLTSFSCLASSQVIRWRNIYLSRYKQYTG